LGRAKGADPDCDIRIHAIHLSIYESKSKERAADTWSAPDFGNRGVKKPKVDKGVRGWTGSSLESKGKPFLPPLGALSTICNG